MSSKSDLHRYFATNTAWANAVATQQPDFFETMAKGQSPKMLWLGCADSRVPESVVLAVKPGEVFVHRNIANQFHLHDDSALSVLTYAVENLGVERVVVVGHTQCGGIRGAYEIACNHGAEAETADSPLGRWLTPLIKLAKDHGIPSVGEEKGIPQLTIESIKRQVANVASTSIIQNAWANGRPVSVHGWLYHLETGKLEDLEIDVYPPEAAH